MSIRYDHKGKYFTEVKKKDTILARIQTTKEQVIGVIHVQPDLRLLDEINNIGEFIPVTDAEILLEGETVHTAFIALNRNHILWILPLDEQEESSTPETMV